MGRSCSGCRQPSHRGITRQEAVSMHVLAGPLQWLKEGPADMLLLTWQNRAKPLGKRVNMIAWEWNRNRRNDAVWSLKQSAERSEIAVASIGQTRENVHLCAFECSHCESFAKTLFSIPATDYRPPSCIQRISKGLLTREAPILDRSTVAQLWWTLQRRQFLSCHRSA